MGTMRFLLLLGSLTLLLSLMVSAHSQPGNREGDHLDSVKRQNSKNGHHTNERNENKEVTRRTGVFSALGGERDRTKLSKPRPGFISTVSVKDTPNIMDLSRHSLENGRRRRQSNGKYGKPKKPCPSCYFAMGRQQKQKRDLEEREPSRKRGHKKPKDRTHPSRGLGTSMKQEREDSKGRRKERGRGEHRHGSLSGLTVEEEPRRPHGHHKKEKHGKHRKNHQHEHSDGKDNKEE